MPDRLLFVEDEPALLRAYARAARGAGYDVEAAPDATSACSFLATGGFDAVITDIALPGMDGLQVLRASREVDPDVPVLLVTGGPTLETAVEAVELGAFRYLVKPVNPDVLLAAIAQAVRIRRLARLKREAFELYGRVSEEIRDELDQRFRRALESLWMVFQPVVSSRTRSVFGYEALMRCDEPSLARPLALLDAAERLGKLPDLASTVWRSVHSRLPDLPSDSRILVNVHPRDLEKAAIAAEDSPLASSAGRVVLEITERAELPPRRDVRTRIATLRRMGYRFALDDLGAGHSGLATLAELSPEFVKIDMALIRGIDTDGVKRKLVGGLASLCRELDITVIAEGVETNGERDALVESGCDLLQGYLFGRPERAFLEPRW